MAVETDLTFAFMAESFASWEYPESAKKPIVARMVRIDITTMSSTSVNPARPPDALRFLVIFRIGTRDEIGFRECYIIFLPFGNRVFSPSFRSLPSPYLLPHSFPLPSSTFRNTPRIRGPTFRFIIGVRFRDGSSGTRRSRMSR